MDRAIILAGGFGTRLQPAVSDRPKALAEVSGKPFIEHQLEWLISQGITNVTLAVHHMAEQLQDFADRYSKSNIIIDAVYENEPLGTGGAVTNVIQQKSFKGNVLVINGDTLFRFSLKPVIKYWNDRKSSIILIASKLQDVSRFGKIIIEDSYVRSFEQATGRHQPGIVNSGAYLIDCSVFSNKRIEPFSLEHDLFPELAKNRQLLAYVLDDSESFFDIGTPESYNEIRSSN